MNTDMEPVNQCLRLLEDTVGISIEGLYSAIHHCLFQGVDYDSISCLMPKWILNEGISPEGKLSKDEYENFRNIAKHPIFGLFMYYYDFWTIISAIQDRLHAVSMFLSQFYSHIPCAAHYSDNQYTSATRQCGEIETSLHVLLNSIFVSYASVFDLLAKVARDDYSGVNVPSIAF